MSHAKTLGTVAVALGLLLGCQDAGFGLDFWPKFLKKGGDRDRAGSRSEARAENLDSSGPASPLTLPDFVQLAEALNPCVVNISTSTVRERQRKFQFQLPPENDPFREFFERYFNQQEKSKSLGSGIIISKEGFILTNNHVVEGADKVRVRRSDNDKEIDAEIKGNDPKTDLALLKISGNDLPVCSLGNSDDLKVGEWVMAIGNPFGFSHTVTVGVVSAIGRHGLDLAGAAPTYQDFIQTDAAINPGNSGGPLINTNGEVVGINTAIYTRTGGSMGIGFAIPINMAKSIIPQLREKGKVVRAWLGVLIQQVTPEVAESLGLKEPVGALVSKVVEGSPAAESGVQRRDVIVEFEGHKIKAWNELPNLVSMTEVGKKVLVKVIRSGKEKDLKVKLAELPDEPQVASAEVPPEDTILGLKVEKITPENAQYYNLEPSDSGVVVVEVEPGSPADEAGIRKGDVILEIGPREVRDMSDFRRAIDEAQKGSKPALVLVKRGDATIYLTLEAGKK